MLSVLIVVAILGTLTVALLAMNSGGSNSKSGSTLLPVAGQRTQASPGAAGPDIAAAGIEVCRTDVVIVNEAVSEYEALKGQPPRNMADLAGILKSPVESSRFTIMINPTHPGQVEVSTPGHTATAGDANCAYA